jgi:hypothetical protein
LRTIAFGSDQVSNSTGAADGLWTFRIVPRI